MKDLRERLQLVDGTNQLLNEVGGKALHMYSITNIIPEGVPTIPLHYRDRNWNWNKLMRPFLKKKSKKKGIKRGRDEKERHNRTSDLVDTPEQSKKAKVSLSPTAPVPLIDVDADTAPVPLIDVDAENKLLVVYPFPFGVDEAVLKEAASGLKELGGDLLGLDDIDDSKPPADAAMQGVQSDVEEGGKGKSSRTHYVTIRDADVAMLRPGEYLNDVLVDFWMRW